MTTDPILRKLQLTQLDILKVIDEICRKHDIHYSLYAGTLLGAVRHQGFIPWDDDLDICMERPEYNRFLIAWKEEKLSGYYLQNKENSPQFTQSFSKIRKEHTTFLQEDWEAGKYGTGIFVDIFPIDRMPDGKIQRAFFTWKCLQYQLFCREFVPPKAVWLQKMIAAFLLKFTPEETRRDRRIKLLSHITKDQNSNHCAVAIETLDTVRMPLPSDLCSSYTTLLFEDYRFMCFSNWKVYLKYKFGDYMTLPPESERTWKHHPIILDFERDYDELLESGNLPEGLK